ncbi:hypothetical protein G6F56_000859 [Rhizopus delemar]|nr:hypothetical protein G6F56_000859 [Rhizopus delemar]
MEYTDWYFNELYLQDNYEQATPEPHRFNAIIKQGVTSTVYPVRGVFGSGCARHDTVFKMADMASGEGFKYPLACIGSLDDKENRQVPLHFMYDVVCSGNSPLWLGPVV